MNENIRTQIAAVLDELRKLHPEWRLGQLVANVAMWAKGPADSAVWDVEDEEFLKAAREHIARTAANRQIGARRETV
jgi:hypothetical protein